MRQENELVSAEAVERAIYEFDTTATLNVCDGNASILDKEDAMRAALLASGYPQKVAELEAANEYLTAQVATLKCELNFAVAANKTFALHNADLSAQVEALKRDAERWHFFRKLTVSQDDRAQSAVLEQVHVNASESDLDAIIDAALKSSTPEQT